ncbi:MAG: GGDEF domain-containing protein [Helicobacteraceae bacterium]|jgi:diguanylate cyclase (GGDEF)-like protein|nr:GGDEF domain-containing protein [Helicobacteraceae bacterium]
MYHTNISGGAFTKELIEVVRIIIEEELITTVFQPIVSLSDGKVFAYEALSRIVDKELEINIETMFKIADAMRRSWELETLCRTKALNNAARKPKEAKLFLNVNANIIYDEKFIGGFTTKRLLEYKFDPSDIAFEITERTMPSRPDAFLTAINHYKEQNYAIAIDDVGSGFSGLNLIVEANPNFLKMDMSLVRDIDKDNIKISLCRALVDFCRNTKINLIAEGIETEEELRTLIKIGVNYGQGFFLGIPKRSFEDIDPEKAKTIAATQSKYYVENVTNSVQPRIGFLSKKGYTCMPDERALTLFEMVKANPAVTEICILNENKPVGFITKSDLFSAFGGIYGHSISRRKHISELMRSDFLKVDQSINIDDVSRIAMQRPYERLYNPIVVEKDNKYFGVVTVKDLLDARTKIQIEIAKHSNPLTGLPGNLLIEGEIFRRIFDTKPYCITYYDIDNFKAYNDAYGFVNGDLMLKLLSDILRTCSAKNEFIGHIGGDDFVVIADYHDGEEYCKKVIETFSQRIFSLYNEEDVKNGFIVSKNRHGVTENFPIASLSVAGVTNRRKAYKNLEDFSLDAARIKKICKIQKGNHLHIE